MQFILEAGQLSFGDIRLLLDETATIQLDEACYDDIDASERIIADIIQEGKIVYGINTGFGALASTRIQHDELEIMQRNIVLSHAAGTGELLSDQIVRLILALKINSLARGYSGVRRQTIDALIKLFNAGIYPCIPSQGSVGASGDLAPLAHLSTVLLGVGEARYQGRIISAMDALAMIDMAPLKLAPKEGLALLNGTQVSTAIALIGLLAAEDIFVAALTAGALTNDATLSSTVPFDERIQAIRGHDTQKAVASLLRQLLQDSEMHLSHANCNKVQDPYSLRCQPQVMGACLHTLLFTANTLLVEANAVSDNPLIFTESREILSGGNFHAEPVAFAADHMALSIAEMAALSERRIALLMDPDFSSLPSFLVNKPGVNSGFMIAQVTAAALASENKSLAHPACVDSLPTSANQEDHVSMATYAARRLLTMADNAAGIVGIELLAACQGIDFRRPLKTSPILEQIFKEIREIVQFYDKDRYFAPDIASIKSFIKSGRIRKLVNFTLC